MRKLWLGLFFGLNAVLLGNLGQAQVINDTDLTLVPTRAVEPLQVLIRSSGADGLFSGEVLSRRPLQANVLQFTLLDQYKGIAWQDKIELPKKGRRIMPFYFPAIGSTAPLLLSVQAYDNIGNTVGSGHKYVQLEAEVPTITVTYNDVFLDDESNLNFTTFMENGGVSQAYLPQIKIYKGLEYFDDLKRTLYQDLIVLDPKQKKELNFSIPFDFIPGVYEVVVTLVDPVSKKPLSSSFRQQIYKAGDYFKIMDLEAYYTRTDKSEAHIDVSGLATVVLTDPMQMQIRLQHQRNIYLDKTISLVLEPGYFTKTIALELPDYVTELSGVATFSLRGEKFQTVRFSSDRVTDTQTATAPEPNKDLLPASPPVLREAPKFVLSENQIWIIVTVCTTLLLLVVIIGYVRSRWLVVAILGLGGSSLALTAVALTIGRNVFPMVEWSDPIPQERMLFNPSSIEGFQYLPVKGRIFNYLTQTALIKEASFADLRFNIVGPDNDKYQYRLSPEVLKEATEPYLNQSTGEYYFVIDLAKVGVVEPEGSSEILRWREGDWQLQLLFPLPQEERTIWLATPLDEFGNFKIDQQPPFWQWQLKKTNGELMSETDFTNQGVRVALQCQDQHTACAQESFEFLVKGNFCRDGTQCNTQASRNLQLCDEVGNCSSQELSVRGYDPVPPNISIFSLGGSNAFVAQEDYNLLLRYEDPVRVESEDWAAEFDPQLCTSSNLDFRFNPETAQCEERRRRCVLEADFSVWRGNAVDGVCEPECPEGYRFQNGSCQTVCENDQFLADRLCLPFKLTPDA